MIYINIFINIIIENLDPQKNRTPVKYQSAALK